MSAAASVLLQAGLEPVSGYVLIKRLGGGGFGEVWKARGPGGIEVALKFIKLEGNAGATEQRALDTIRAIRHPNLLTPTAAWTVQQVLVLAMELADGTLQDRLHQAREQGHSGIPRDELHEYMYAAACGLDHLNQHKHTLGDKKQVGVQHRDVKPQNILLVGGGIKVADFGLARVLEKSQSGHSGGMTVAYAAPEFFKNQTSEHSDQYCLAATYCELRTGKVLFDGDSMLAVMHQHLNEAPDLGSLPAGERSAVVRALAKEPQERWPSCRAFVEALRAAQPNAKQSVKQASAPPPSKVPQRSTRQPAAPRDDSKPIIASAGDAKRSLAKSKRAAAISPSPDGKATHGEGTEPTSISNRKLPTPAILLTVLGVLALTLLSLWLAGFFSRKIDPKQPEFRDLQAKLNQATEASKTIAKQPEAGPGSPPATYTSPKTSMAFVLIRPGTFKMGSPEDEEGRNENEPLHDVEITRAFYLGKYEVTRGQFRQFVDETGYKTDAEKSGKGSYYFDSTKGAWEQRSGYTWRHTGFDQADDHPVVNVSWNDALAYCAWLKDKEGREYTLPTEAQWEYACRAGTSTKFSSGNNPETLVQVGNIADGTVAEIYPKLTTIQAKDGYIVTAPVGKFEPNAWGLHDMHGNAWEWCLDAYDQDYYQKSPPKDPSNADPTILAAIESRIVRGGSWINVPKSCRCANRNVIKRDLCFSSIGFRVCILRD